MAHHHHITTGSGRIVGTVSVDGGAVRGEDGSVRPQLVLPVTITMRPQPEDQMLATIALTAWLTTQRPATVQNAVGEPIQRSLVNGLPARSFPCSTGDTRKNFASSSRRYWSKTLEQ